MRIVFYCPTEIKEIKEIFIPHGEALSVISVLSVGRLLSHADSIFIVPRKWRKSSSPSAQPFLLFLLFLRDNYYLTRIVLLLSRRNKGNKGNSLTRPMRSPFCYFCYFCGTLLSHADSILLSRSHRLCRFARRRNEGNKGNSSFGCCLRSAFGLNTSGEGTSETYMRIFFAKKTATSATWNL